MAPFSSAKEKQANLFNGDNEEDKRICSFGDEKACGVLHCGQQRWRAVFFLFPAKGFWTKMSHILSQGEDVENITVFLWRKSILSLIYSFSRCNFMEKPQRKEGKVLRWNLLWQFLEFFSSYRSDQSPIKELSCVVSLFLWYKNSYGKIIKFITFTIYQILRLLSWKMPLPYARFLFH